MQDTKEQPPPTLPEDIARMSKHKLSSDSNPREIFWVMVEAYENEEGFEELVKKYGGIREALVNIGCSVLQEPSRAHRVRIARAKLAKCIFSMIVIGRWGDVLGRALSNLYERKRGPELNMLMAFGDGFSNNKELVGGWLKEMLAKERPEEEVLSYITNAGDREMAGYLRGELLNIARTEINEPQIYSMEALALLMPKDAEVAKLFVDMMDDWDIETKKIALETLKACPLPEAARKAVTLYVYEPDELFRVALEQIIGNNKEGAAGEITKMFGRLRGKEAEELGGLAKRVYGKEKAKALIPKELPLEIRKEAEKTVE